MSLLRQLWLIVLFSTALAFAGGFAVNLYSARQYLEHQLLTQSTDNAASLALSMSQQSKDAATAELMVSALFDSGHFRMIRYEDVQGNTVVERRNDAAADGVPAWFVNFMPLKIQPGIGAVSDGWNQAGRVVVLAHERFAYRSLWEGALTFLMVMVLTGLASGFAVTALIRWVRKPLEQMTRQADAIGERRFITIDEPDVSELRVVVRTMNAMVDRVKAMFAEQASRIDELRANANRDSLTGLPNREFFLGHLRQTLHDETATPDGALLLLRLHDLNARNQQRGRAATDAYLRKVSEGLQARLIYQNDVLLARLNGADFVILLPGANRTEAQAIGEACMQGVLALNEDSTQAHVHVGLAFYENHDKEGTLLAAADEALAQAVATGTNAVRPAERSGSVAESASMWQTVLEQAILARSFTLNSYPVLDTKGELIHQEVLLRLRNADGQLLTAGQFMPMATRFGLLTQLDLIAVELACMEQDKAVAPRAVNLSAASLADPTFLPILAAVLEQYSLVAGHLWFEVNEQGLGGDYKRLADLAELVHRYGCRVGIEHFGRQFGHIPALYDLRLDYIKIDGSFIREIDKQPGNQQLVKAMVGVSSGVGLLVLAEAVHAAAEWDCLQALGVEGMTGPLATSRYQPAG